MPNFSNDIAPGANYMDRKRCFSIYFYTYGDCHDCAKLEECKKQVNALTFKEEVVE